MTYLFRARLLDWYRQGHRDLPWRSTGDPYAIWVSEIMLQQTRVAVVIPYYQRFVARFPSPRALADASESALLAAWAGLGYYSRVRNMQRAARQIEGAFPSSFDEIRKLPGIGDYTAAAIASIAFGLPHAAVDGNVLRVLSRITDDAGDISSMPVRKRLAARAQDLLDPQQPGDFNQALMELGATVCLPREPQCLLCPVAEVCSARAAGRQDRLPTAKPRPPAIHEQRTVIVAVRDEAVLLWQRTPGSGKLAGFWELPEPEHVAGQEQLDLIGSFRHSILNRIYTVDVTVPRGRLSLTCKNVVNCAWIPRNRAQNMALSTTARKALKLYASLWNLATSSGGQHLNEEATHKKTRF